MLYDCFTFFNELDLLDIRLHTLNDVVDRFVIVEATKTFTGEPRDLVLLANTERYRQFLPKIIYVIVRNLPQDGNAWVREAFQRNAISKGLTNCQAGDYVMISDVDEIPHPGAIEVAKKADDVVVLVQNFYYYYLNCKGDETWQGTRILPIEKLTKPQTARSSGKYIIRNGGWHFSYQGGVDAIIKKISSFSHQEFNTDYYKDPKRIQQAMSEGKDLFGRSNKWGFVEIDDSYPEYIRNNQEKFSHMIFKPDSSPPHSPPRSQSQAQSGQRGKRKRKQ